MRWLSVLMAAGWMLVAAPVAHAAKNPFRVVAEDLSLKPAAEGVVRITLAVPKGHHAYRDMLEVKVVDAGGLSFGAASLPPGESKPDPANPTATREQYDIDVIIEVPLTAPKVAGKHTATFAVRYQGCKASLCWMPKTDEVSATITIDPNS